MQPYDMLACYRSHQVLYHYIVVLMVHFKQIWDTSALCSPLAVDPCKLKAFGAKLDWATERLFLFGDINISIPIIYTETSIRSQYCCVITQNSDTAILNCGPSKYVVLAEHEAVIHVYSTARPQSDTLALIEPNIVTTDSIEDTFQDDVWRLLVLARTVTSWCAKKNSAVVQVANPSHRSIRVQLETIVGTISSVTAIPESVASIVEANSSESAQAQTDLPAALDKSFKDSTVEDQQQAQVLDLCTVVPFLHYPRKSWVNVLLRKLDFLIISRIRPIQERKKCLTNVLRSWSLMTPSQKARVHGNHPFV